MFLHFCNPPVCRSSLIKIIFLILNINNVDIHKFSNLLFYKKGEKSIIIFLFPYKDAKLQLSNPFMHGL